MICLLALAMTLTCCKSNKRMIRSEVGYVSTQPVEVAVQEKVQDTLIVEEEPLTVKKEKVGLTDGADLMRYCIIQELIRIRRQYPQFRDAWLLEVKED